VKKLLNLFSVFIFILIYGFAVGLHGTNAKQHVQVVKQQAGTEKLQSYISSELFFHTSQYESPVNAVNKLPHPTSKNSPFKLFICSVKTEHVHHIVYALYHFFYINILVRFFETDIIFPFHYFW